MGLRDELAPPYQRGGTCTVRSFVAESGDEAEEWIELLDDASVQHRQLWRLMHKHGYTFGAQAVQRHRRGECICGRTA